MAGPLFFAKLRSHPEDREQPWSEELQGVTHDDAHWFITQKSRLWKIPARIDLSAPMHADDAELGILTAPLPAEAVPGYDHLGDLDGHAGLLFVALEDSSGAHDARVAVFDAADLRFVASAVLPGQGRKGPWCAVRPQDGLLYSSAFEGVNELRGYAWSLAGDQLTLGLHHTLPLHRHDGSPFRLDGIQGGVFTAEGEFYLSSNDGDFRGVQVFQAGGERLKHLPIDTELLAFGEEIEGLTYWNLDNGLAPRVRGQLHVLELDNDIDADDLKAFHHYRVERSRFVANSNPSCREVHHWDCVWVGKMLERHKQPYGDLASALADGFDGCHYCLPEHDTR
jgi:hypothetical protein